MKEQITAYYNRYATVYETKHGVGLAGQHYNFHRYYEPFLDQVAPTQGLILELGSGTGIYTEWLLQRGLSVVGIDLSSEMLAKARERCPQTLFVEGDGEDPASSLGSRIPREGFDAIVGVNAFSYFPHKEKALQNFKELLRPGGRFILMDMNGACPYYPLMAWSHKNEMHEWLPQIRESNARSLKALLEKTGFRLDRLEHFAFIPNGVHSTAVNLIQPLDLVLEFLPFARPFAMRIALAAISEKKIT